MQLRGLEKYCRDMQKCHRKQRGTEAQQKTALQVKLRAIAGPEMSAGGLQEQKQRVAEAVLTRMQDCKHQL